LPADRGQIGSSPQMLRHAASNSQTHLWDSTKVRMTSTSSCLYSPLAIRRTLPWLSVGAVCRSCITFAPTVAWCAAKERPNKSAVRRPRLHMRVDFIIHTDEEPPSCLVVHRADPGQRRNRSRRVRTIKSTRAPQTTAPIPIRRASACHPGTQGASTAFQAD
jgi:hypothetical protein